MSAGAPMPDVQGRCPACGGASLFLGEGGHVTCSRIDCPAPDTGDMLLHGGETALVVALGGDRKARVVAHTLHFHGHSIFDVHRMTDEQFLAVPGIGDTSLARIRAAIPASEPDVAVVTELARLREGLHKFRYALDSRAGRETTTDFVREMLNAMLTDPGEPCDRDQQYARAERAEETIRRVSAFLDGIDTPDWRAPGTEVALRIRSLISESPDQPEHAQVKEQRERPTRPDGTPYSYYEITAEGWGFCDGCRMWSTASPERPHECSGSHMRGPVIGTARIAFEVQPDLADGREGVS